MTKFVKGVSGNPAGRPKGARGRYKMFQDALEPHILDLADVLLDRAKAGDMVAMRLLIDRLVPKAVDHLDVVEHTIEPLRIELVGVKPLSQSESPEDVGG